MVTGFSKREDQKNDGKAIQCRVQKGGSEDDHQTIVIAHQDPRMNPTTGLSSGFGQTYQEIPAVLIITEYLFTPIAPVLSFSHDTCQHSNAEFTAI